MRQWSTLTSGCRARNSSCSGMADLAQHRARSCPECGASLKSDGSTCKQLFEAVIAKEFSDYTYARTHRLTVDVYALQHPDQYMKSAKSFAAHLTGIYAALEHDDKVLIDQQIQQWLNSPVEFLRPEPPPPAQRGKLNIAYVHDASSGEQHQNRVREWAESTWRVWQGYEYLAKSWIGKAAAISPIPVKQSAH